MPAGLVNALASRQQFLDLVRYLMEIAEYGPARARALRPDPALVAPPLPEYERRLDHAGLIAGLGPDSLRRGEAIYSRVCANCHGTKDQPGSLPTAPRFASAALKNGSDPYSLYRTLTDGFGQMAPQTWMVPRQKYDVIHYIREAFLKPHNPAQYAAIDRAYLDRPPQGDDPRPRAVGDRALGRDGLRPEPDGDHRGRRRRLELRLQGDRRPARPGAGGRLAGQAWVALRPRHAAPGRRLDRPGLHRLERHQLQRPAPGPSPRSSAGSTSPTPTAPAGPTRTTRRSTTPASSAATAAATAPCRATGRATGGSTTTATG